MHRSRPSFRRRAIWHSAHRVAPRYPAADIPAIEELLQRVARLVEEIPEIAELDLNPVIALPPGRGCQIVDARIRVAQ